MSYKIHGEWRDAADVLIAGLHGTDVRLKLEVTDLIDSHDHVWQEGAWRVRRNGKILRTFKGETAWSDSRRLFEDQNLLAMRDRK